MEIILKLTGIGIAVAVLAILLRQSGREDASMMVTIAGIVVELMIILDMIFDLLGKLQAFSLL